MTCLYSEANDVKNKLASATFFYEAESGRNVINGYITMASRLTKIQNLKATSNPKKKTPIHRSECTLQPPQFLYPLRQPDTRPT